MDKKKKKFVSEMDFYQKKFQLLNEKKFLITIVKNGYFSISNLKE